MLKNIQENITPRKLLIGSLIFCAFISLVGVTWAWFSPIETGDNNVVEVNATTASLSITYDGGNEFKVENILPGWTGTKTFTVTNTGDAPAQYDINWSTLVNTFTAKSDFVYTISSTNKGGTLSETAIPGSAGTIISDNIIGVGVTQEYTITFKYINRESTQNDQGKKISGKIVINEDNESFDTFYIQEDSTQSTNTTNNVKVTKVADETLTYYTKDSMTWETWVGTGLNYDDFIVDGNNIKNSAGYLVKDGSGNSILKTATISAETSYKMKPVPDLSLANRIISISPTTTGIINSEGLMKVSQPETGQTPAQTEYRYSGGWKVCSYNNGDYFYPLVSNECTTLYDYTRTYVTDSSTTNYNYKTSIPDSTDYYTYEQTASYTGTIVESIVNNYITFNNEMWRIIGVFSTDDGNGKYENRVRILREDYLSEEMKWNSLCAYSTSGGWRITGGTCNNWTQATLNTYLNGTYYNSMTSTAKDQISDAKWYINPTDVSSSSGTAAESYVNERGTSGLTKINSSGDTTTRPTNWTGKIGLLYISDYGYASSRCYSGVETLYDYDKTACKYSDWIFRDDKKNYAAIIPNSTIGMASLRISSNGIIGSYYSSFELPVRIVTHLNSNVQITGGTGTSSDPYTIS